MFLAFQNLRKQKRHYFSFALMLFLTAVIVNLSLVLSFQISKAYDQNFNRLKTAQLNVLISQKQDSKDLLKEIDKIQGVTLVERHQGIFTKAKVHHFAGTDFEMTTVFYDSSQKRNLNRFELSKSSKVASQSVYIPNYISKLGGFPLGSKIRYTIGKKDYTYSVAGTVEEMQYGNYGTNVIGIYLPHNAYQSLFKEEEAHSVAEYSLKVSSSSDLSVVKKKLTSLLSDKGIAAVLIKDSKTVKQARTMMSTLLIAIFIAVAGIVFIISLFLSAFRIQNHLKSEVVNMGVLKAMGYTSAKIIFSEVLPYLLVAMIATVTGVLTSYLVLPFLASFLAVQSGFSFQPTFDSYALCLIVVFVTGVAGGLTYLCARKIHRFNPIDAVRRTDSTRRFSNHFSLANSKLGISGALILKQVFASFWQNMLLFVLTVGLMMLLAFSGTLLYNTAGKPDNFLRTLSEELPSAIFTVDKPQELQNIKKELKSDSRVKQVLDYSTQSVNGPDGGLTAFVTPDFSKLTNDIIYKGRNPSTSDEVAIGSALAHHYKIGDWIRLDNNGRSHTYKVTGYVQSVNNQGQVCELTAAGYHKITETRLNHLNVYLKKGASVRRFIKEYRKNHSNSSLKVTNYDQVIKTGSRLYTGVIALVLGAVFTLSIFMISLVLFVVINSLITRRKQELGIYKALGWSDRQLIFQLIFGFIPVIILAAFLSILLAIPLIPLLNQEVLGLVGVYKNHFQVSLGVLFLLALAFVGLNFAISLFLSRSIKTIVPYSLLTE